MRGILLRHTDSSSPDAPQEPVSEADDKVLTAIMCDLEQARRARRVHFVPALVLVGMTMAGVFVSMNVRADLWQQPPGQLALQIALWVMCLLILPAIGVGLAYPRRSMKAVLAIGALLLAIGASTGWPFAWFQDVGSEAEIARCMMLEMGTGLMLVFIGFFSGAFVQLRRRSAVLWVGGGLTLIALNVVTWCCPASGIMHVLPGHLGGALLLMTVAVVAGSIFRRRESMRS